MRDLRFPKRLRLLRASEFERVFATRNSVGNAHFVLYGAANEVGFARLGITVSRRVGNAVARNRWKRLLREAFRLSQHALPNLDFVCVVRAPTPPALAQLMAKISESASRLERRGKAKGTGVNYRRRHSSPKNPPSN